VAIEFNHPGRKSSIAGREKNSVGSQLLVWVLRGGEKWCVVQDTAQLVWRHGARDEVREPSPKIFAAPRSPPRPCKLATQRAKPLG